MPTLLEAVRAGDLKAVQAAIKGGENVDMMDERGCTPLVEAARCGRTNIVRELVSSGATVDLADKLGKTALIEAATGGHRDTVTELLKSGATVDMTNRDGSTALMRAAWWGKTRIVKNLLKSGATVDLADESGETALILAARYGHLAIVRELLSSRATVDLANSLKYGDTPLIEATRNGFTESVRELLPSGADVFLVNKAGQTALMEARQSEPPNYEIIRLLEEAEERARQEQVPCVPILPKNWTAITDKETNKPVYQNVDSNSTEDKLDAPPGYPLLQSSAHPEVTFYDEPQEKQFSSDGGHVDFDNGVEMTVPPNTIPTASTLGVKVQPSLAPKDVFVMPVGIQSASPSYLISSKGKNLNGEVTLTIEHHLDVKTQKEADDLVFLQADSFPKMSGSKPVYEFQEVQALKSEFVPGESKGSLTTSLKDFSNKLIRVGVKPEGHPTPEGSPSVRNLYTVRVYQSPTQTSGDKKAIIVVSLQGRLYSKFLEALDAEMTAQVPKKTIQGSRRFEEKFAKLDISSIDGWSVDADKKKIFKTEVDSPETENFKPEELHDYPPRIECEFTAEDDAPKRTTCTLSFTGLEPEVEVDIPLKAPMKTAVDTRKLWDATDKLKITAVEVTDVQLGSIVASIIALMGRLTAALQLASLSELAVHTDAIKMEIESIMRVCKRVADDCTRQTIKKNIEDNVSKMTALSHQLGVVTKVKLKYSQSKSTCQSEQKAALDDLVMNSANLVCTVECLLKDIQTLNDISSIPVDDPKLRREILESDLYHLARCFDTVEGYLDQLGLRSGQQTDVRTKSLLHGTEVAMEDALRLWRQKHPFGVTFKALVEILLTMKKGRVANRVYMYCVSL